MEKMEPEAIRGQASIAKRNKPDEFQAVLDNLIKENYSLKSKALELESKLEEIEESGSKLKVNHEKLQKFFEFSPVGFVCLSLESNFMQFNDKLPAMLGYKREELANSALLDFIFEEDVDKFNYFRSKILNSYTTHTCEIRLIKSNKTYLNARLDGVLVDYNTKHIHIAISDNTYIKIYEDSIKIGRAHV